MEITSLPPALTRFLSTIDSSPFSWNFHENQEKIIVKIIWKKTPEEKAPAASAGQKEEEEKKKSTTKSKSPATLRRNKTRRRRRNGRRSTVQPGTSTTTVTQMEEDPAGPLNRSSQEIPITEPQPTNPEPSVREWIPTYVPESPTRDPEPYTYDPEPPKYIPACDSDSEEEKPKDNLDRHRNGAVNYASLLPNQDGWKKSAYYHNGFNVVLQSQHLTAIVQKLRPMEKGQRRISILLQPGSHLPQNYYHPENGRKNFDKLLKTISSGSIVNNETYAHLPKYHQCIAELAYHSTMQIPTQFTF